ncbi:YciI family protein [Actinomycetospora sp. CA-053990]|uniref:YciI family protein n=1 Tax=Actinomycetospora sp. CA-053990 TaxID=3239891 RepID=UPI003D9271D9
MFVVVSAYNRAFGRGEPVRSEHLEFVKSCHDDGLFVASGPRRPAVGGLIIARGDDEQELRTLMLKDPFVRDGIASYEFFGFRPSRAVGPELAEQDTVLHE